jgi:hypothetical protein
MDEEGSKNSLFDSTLWNEWTETISLTLAAMLVLAAIITVTNIIISKTIDTVTVGASFAISIILTFVGIFLLQFICPIPMPKGEDNSNKFESSSNAFFNTFDIIIGGISFVSVVLKILVDGTSKMFGSDWLGVFITVVGYMIFIWGLLINEIFDSVIFSALLTLVAFIFAFVGFSISLMPDANDLAGSIFFFIEELITSIGFSLAYVEMRRLDVFNGGKIFK